MTVPTPRPGPRRIRPLHALEAALLAALLAAGCGPARYMPLQVVWPAPLDDSTAQAGPVRITVRAGAEWLEVELENRGASPLEVWWSEASLVTPGGRVHALVEADRLQGPSWSGFDAFAHDADAWGGSRFGHASPAPALGPGARPEAWSAPVSMVLRPDTRATTVLYPLDHLARNGPSGWAPELPLLCDDGPHAARPGLIRLHIPARSGERALPLFIHARLGGT